MTPDQTQNNKKFLQALLTIILALIFMGIIGLYIYFGMMQAGKNVVTDTITTAPVATSSTPATTETAQAQRARILANLAAQSSPEESSTTMSADDRAKILKNLSASTGAVSTTTAENRAKILEAIAKENNQITTP
jgi:flagellar basal body-associated protein FliL